MATNAYEAYLESKILAADPVELVRILCRGALDAIRQARVELHDGRVRERSRAITRAGAMLNELALSVDHAAGGELSRNLVELYAYLQSLLIDANSRQIAAPLEEAEKILAALAEAWKTCRVESPAPAAEYAPLNCSC